MRVSVCECFARSIRARRALACRLGSEQALCALLSLSLSPSLSPVDAAPAGFHMRRPRTACTRTFSSPPYRVKFAGTCMFCSAHHAREDREESRSVSRDDGMPYVCAPILVPRLPSERRARDYPPVFLLDDTGLGGFTEPGMNFQL